MWEEKKVRSLKRYQGFVGLMAFVILTVVISGLVNLEGPGMSQWERCCPQSSLMMTASSLGSPPERLREAATWLAALASRLTVGPRLAEAATATAAATPTSIPGGQPTEVTVTIQLTDPQLIPESVNLQRVDASGKALAVLGTLNDQGLNGDVTPGDQVFTIRQTFTEVTPTAILLRVSWAVRGGLGRAASNILHIEVR